MNYTLNQLSIFLKVTQHGSITKAAEELHLTQPAVSIQLKNFQKQFDIPLTELIGKKLYITEFGREVASAAQNIMNEAYAMETRKLAYQGKLTGRLKISVVSTGKYVMPYFLSGFLKEHDAVELQLDVSNKASVIETLERNEVDFAMVSVLPSHLNLKKIELMQNALFLVGPIAPRSKKTYNKNMLETLPLIYREQGSATRQAMEKFIEKSRIRVRKKIELTSNEAVKQAIIAGLGYSIMPLIGIKNELQNRQLRIIPVKGLPLRSTWHLTWMADKNLSPLAQAYLQHIREEKSNIIHGSFGWTEQYES